MHIKRFILFLLVFGSFLPGFSQDLSNKGKEFWIPYAYHVNQNNIGPLVMTLYLTSDVKTAYTVEIFGGQIIQSDTIQAGQVVSCIIPNNYLLNNEGLFKNMAIRVSARNPIVVYSYITQSAISGATLCLPTNVLGQEYITMNYKQISNVPNSNSYFTVIATEDNTLVEITYAATTKTKKIAGTKDTIQLKKGEIYQVLGDHNNANYNTPQNPLYAGDDLTGSRIKSIGTCKRIAVFSGSGKIRIGDCVGGNNTSDNLYQQNYPVSTWGKTFLTVSSYNRQTNFYRIIKSKPDAIVKINGSVINFSNSTYHEFQSALPSKIESNEPITVAQFFTTQGCNSNPQPYDPDMIILNPVEQNISKVTLVSSNLAAQQNQQHHIHVIMRNNGSSLNSFMFDGIKVPESSWTVHPLDNNFSYIYFNNVTQGYHTLASDSGFNALAYGYANAESYGYSAGSNVRDLNQFASIQNKYAVVNYPSTCKDAPFNLKVTLPYKPTSLAWNFFGDSSLGVNPDTLYGINGNPVVPDTIVKSISDPLKELYVYKVKNKDNSLREFIMRNKGVFPIEVIANNPTKDGCNTERYIPYDLTVYDPPTNIIKPTSLGCLEDTVLLESSTFTDNVPVIKYLWNVNDVTYDTTSKIIKAKYENEGIKKISLSIITEIGCISKVFDTTVLLSHKPIPQFEAAGSVCLGKTQKILDKSTLKGNSTIEEWIWSYDNKFDPDTFFIASETRNPTKQFDDSLLIVQLDLKTNSGCTNSLKDTLYVKPNPAVEMFLPEICLEDAVANFKSLSTIPGESTLDLFEWNFGDSLSSKDENIGTGEKVSHSYKAPGGYTVSLKVTSNYGCISNRDTSFFINGSYPKADFNVINESGLCSNKPIVIENKSTVQIGSIGKLDVYWNLKDNILRPDSIDENPTSASIYVKSFPDFNDKPSIEIPIRLVVYTGGVCKDSIDKTIVLNGSPLDSLKDLDPICTRKERRLLNVAVIQPVSAVNGDEVYTGKGVIKDGGKYYFDPKIDSGYYTIYHKYTTEKGCFAEDSTLQRVNFTPVIDAGPDITVLDDTTKQIIAKAVGVGMKYLWTPKTYLNTDTILQPFVSNPQNDILYTLTVTGTGNCVETDQFRMTALNMVEPTNTFTPNGDGFNDIWKIKHIEKYPDCNVELYSPQGNLIYRINTGTQKAWDGTINGRPMPAGTYYYIINPKNNRKKITGYVTLLR
ncbi:MAG: gliding motility-associated C-terminal domain-containing protein [Chitinophagaceae bacterium]